MAVSSPAAVSLYDARPFFEKTLSYGVTHGIIDQIKLDAMRVEAPKGMVQIARYFGTEFLRPELEKARERIVNLISLNLEVTSNGDLHHAAETLRDHSLLSRSKGGSDLLKALIAMPQNSHFGMHEHRGFRDEQIPLLAKWTLRSVADYRTELAQRSEVAQVVDAAVWLADRLGLSADELEEAGKDAEAVIRTALLALAAGRTKMPDWPAFETLVVSLRKAAKGKTAKSAASLPLPVGLPEAYAKVVREVRESVLADMPKITDEAMAPRQLFDRSPAFMGRYFWMEDGLAEVDHHDRTASDAWNKVTGRHTDDGSLITLLLCIAAGNTPKTMLAEKAATSLIKKIQKSGFKPELASQYIREHAPVQFQEAYEELWLDFVDEAGATLRSDAVQATQDAIALLRREGHVK